MWRRSSSERRRSDVMPKRLKWAPSSKRPCAASAIKNSTKPSPHLVHQVVREFSDRIVFRRPSAWRRNEVARATSVGTTSRRCLLYTSDAADDLLCVDLGGRRIIK